MVTITRFLAELAPGTPALFGRSCLLMASSLATHVSLSSWAPHSCVFSLSLSWFARSGPLFIMLFSYLRLLSIPLVLLTLDAHPPSLHTRSGSWLTDTSLEPQAPPSPRVSFLIPICCCNRTSYVDFFPLFRSPSPAYLPLSPHHASSGVRPGYCLFRVASPRSRMLLSCFHVPHFIIVYAFILAASLERVGPIIRCLHSINEVMLTGDGPFRGLAGGGCGLTGTSAERSLDHDWEEIPARSTPLSLLRSDDICPIIKQW